MDKMSFSEDDEHLFSRLESLRPDIPQNADEIVSVLRKLTQKMEEYQGTHKYGAEFDVRILETNRQELLDIVEYAKKYPEADLTLKKWVKGFDPRFGNSYGVMNGNGTLPSAEIMLRKDDEITAEFIANISNFARITGTNISIFNILDPSDDTDYSNDRTSLFLVVGGTGFSRGVVIPSLALHLVKHLTVEEFDNISLSLDWALEEIPQVF